MTDRELKSRCAYWQKILRLQDWRVDVRLADSPETDSELAKCRVFQNEKLCIIRILRPEGRDETDDWTRSFRDSSDLEISLVHELLHIPFESLFNDDAGEHEKTMQEQAIHFIAEALVKLSRGA